MSAGPYGHTIKQYSPSGKLLQVLGTAGKAGSGLTPLQFDQPAEIFVHDSTREIYIVDGDGGMNNRLLKLSQGVFFSVSLLIRYSPIHNNDSNTLISYMIRVLTVI